MNDFIEQRIIDAIKKLLTGQVNEILRKAELPIPEIEIGDVDNRYAVSPVVVLSTCERTEKERIIRLDTYSLVITFVLPDTPETELHCYAYSGAISRAIYDNPTFGGIAERVSLTGRKYVPPKKKNCGDGWEVVISLRVTVKGMS
jgi:hypothetical protein